MFVKWRLIYAAAVALRAVGLDLIQYANTRTWAEDGWQKTEVTGHGWRIARRKA